MAIHVLPHPGPAEPPDPIARLAVPGVPPWLRGGHLETVVASAVPLALPTLAAERRVVEVEPATATQPASAVETWWTPPEGAACGSLLLVHGLGGTAQRPHVRALAAEAATRGWHAVRVNLRNHGGTAHLAATLYHAAQSDDLGRVLEAMEAAGLPRPYAVVGVSLGANMALRYAALAGDASRADGVVALNPAIDFFRVEREIDRRENFLYRFYFVRRLCQLLGEIRAVRPVPGPAADPWRIRTVRRFDELFTAPGGGFASVDDYYAHASAAPVIGQLRVPATLLTAANDPFIPVDMVAQHHGAAGGRVRVLVAERGGHVGYRVRGEDGQARFWAAGPVFDELESRLR